jgi:soluble lytic murein transglycosylase
VVLFGQVTRAADPMPAVPEDTSAVRQEFLAAMQRVRQHVAESPDSPALTSDPIYGYLVAARLKRDLDTKPSDELDVAIDTFVGDHPGEPVIRNLRHDWLESLALRGRWDWFLARASGVIDPALVCDRLAGRLATGEARGLPAEALALWMQPQRQPHECDSVFKWLRLQGLVTPEAAEARTRAALAADNARLARDASVDVPSSRLAPLQQWIRLLETPKPALNELAAHPDTPAESSALLAGFTRVSRNDSSAALNLLPLLLARPDMSPALAARMQRAAALGAAYDHHPGALQAFRALPAEAIDNEVFEWRIRSALWAGEFNTALSWINELPEALSSQLRWRYWHARMIEATLGATVAEPLYNEIAGARDYHAYLAADRLHRSYDLNVHPTPDDAAAQTALASAPGLIRAHELFACDLLEDATVEWATVLADAAPATKVQAAHLASRWGWYTQAIIMLAQANEWDDLSLRYPRPYASQLESASTLTKLPADWIVSVMRQESLFRKDATSRADARGLMQLQPSTATAVARRWHLPPPAHDALFDPAASIPLGAAYLRELNDRYGGQLALTLAAYNAGPIPVARWMPATPIDADIWIENIPYNETRSYVQRVLEHIVAYAQVYGAQLPHLAALLPPVEPASPSALSKPAEALKAGAALIESNGPAVPALYRWNALWMTNYPTR